MNYQNMTLKELEREAFSTDNKLARAIFDQLDGYTSQKLLWDHPPKQLELFPDETQGSKPNGYPFP